MTTKQIAESVNKTERSIQRWINKVADKMSGMADKMSASTSTHPADYTLDEVCLIIEKGLGKNAADIYKQNAIQQNIPIKSEAGMLIIEMQKQNQIFMAELHRQNREILERLDKPNKSLPAPPMTDRALLNKIVRDHASSTEIPFQYAWNDLYKAVYYRMKIDIVKRAKNKGMNKLDYAEEHNLINEMVAIAMEIF